MFFFSSRMASSSSFFFPFFLIFFNTKKTIKQLKLRTRERRKKNYLCVGVWMGLDFVPGQIHKLFFVAYECGGFELNLCDVWVGFQF